MRVAAVIPVHNGADFVADAIGSALDQTRPPDEVVVVDDGSTDSTAEVLAGFGDALAVVRRPQGGNAAARNSGVAACNAELIAFLDADDTWAPDKLERQLPLFAARPELGLAYTGLEHVDVDGRHLSLAPPVDPAAAVHNTLLMEPPFVSLAQTGMVRRTAFEAVGGFDEALLQAEDSDLVWRLAVRFPIAAVPAPLARYRHHPSQQHRDITAHGRYVGRMHRKAFASGELPPDVQRLERRVRANLAFTMAYEYRQRGDRRAATSLGRAFYYDPLRVTRWAADRALRMARRP